MHCRRLETTILATGLLAVLAAGHVSAQNVNVAHTTLKAGDMAPDFTLLDNRWNPVRLSNYRGKKNVVLAFYVLAFTEGWTKELQAYQADMAKLKASDAVVLGISIDSPAANNAFAEKIGVTFPLLSDMNRKVLKLYGILKMENIQKEEYGWAQRTTFVVDKQGVIRQVEEEASAINPNNAIAVCTKLPKK
jgi:peroxiredoxin